MPFKIAAQNPLSWVPPSGVGTVLQYDWMKPSREGVQLTAHSILPGTLKRSWKSTVPAKGAAA